jgi:hypothetical protein
VPTLLMAAWHFLTKSDNELGSGQRVVKMPGLRPLAGSCVPTPEAAA